MLNVPRVNQSRQRSPRTRYVITYTFIDAWIRETFLMRGMLLVTTDNRPRNLPHIFLLNCSREYGRGGWTH